MPFPERGFCEVGAAIVEGDRPSRPDHRDLTDDLWTLTQKCWRDLAEDRPGVVDAVEVIKETSVYPLSMRQTHYLPSLKY